MGTTCKIIIKSGDHYKGIRVQYDGYLEGAGVTLFRYYTSDDKVQQLISLGDLNVLAANIGTQFDATDEYLRAVKNSEQQCIAEWRDYGRPLHISDGHTLEDVVEDEGYAYFWDSENWIYCPYGKSLAMLKDLIPIQQAPVDAINDIAYAAREIEMYILKRLSTFSSDKRIKVARSVLNFLDYMTLLRER